MIDNFLIKKEVDHLIRLLFGEHTNTNNTTDIRRRLIDEFDITIRVTSEGGWFGYKYYLVQVLRKKGDDQYVEEHCTGVYGDNGEFQSNESALNYGLLVACTFAMGIKLKQGYLCLDE